ncbi:dentin sialophosphoprotein-like [Dorcoceras hygrometricum]|nr:dentin sialophosphoprotein-like [Dorcoceras hygrometricum]
MFDDRPNVEASLQAIQAGSYFISEGARQETQSMSEFPRELIRRVQISTRSAAGLPGYDPRDPTLPALPSLSAAIAALEPSPPHLRCKLCKGSLVRGLKSNICVYCGVRCENDTIPDPICFNSTIGYEWLLRSLGLDGSEMVKPQTSKNEQDQGQSSPKAELPLSDFINFRIAWPNEIEMQDTAISDDQSEVTKRYWSPTGLTADIFFFKSTNVGTTGSKAVAGLDNQNLFQNVQSEPADGSAVGKTNESISGWQADFQFAVSDNQLGRTKSSVHFMGSADDDGNKIQDSQASHFISPEVDLSAHMVSVFGHGEDLTGKPMDNIGHREDLTDGKPIASPAFGTWDSDDLWTNIGRNESQLVGGSDDTVSPKDPFENLDNLDTSADLFQDFQWQTNNTDLPERKTMDAEDNRMGESQTVGDFYASLSAKDDLTLEISNNLSTGGDDLFQDFQWQTNEADITSIRTVDEEPSTNKQSQLAEGSFATVNAKDDTSKKSMDSSADVDLFQDFEWQTIKTDTSENKKMEGKNNTVDGDAFDEWNDFTGSATLQDPSKNAWIQSDLSTSDTISADIDLFSPNITFDERDMDGFSEPNIFSTSNLDKDSVTENAISSKPSFLSRLSDTGAPSDSASAANVSDNNGISPNPEDDVKMLISQMHDLSFMLKTDLCIPFTSEQNSATQD